MSKQVLFSLLDRANNGNEILSVIDSFAAELQSETVSDNATLEEIQFWCSLGTLGDTERPLYSYQQLFVIGSVCGGSVITSAGVAGL